MMYTTSSATGVSSVAFGASNTASGDYSVVVGGYQSKAFGGGSIVGGNQSEARGLNSVVFGYLNNASGYYASILGGYLNVASVNHAIVVGGYNNSATGSQAIISGGALNTAGGAHCVVSGGKYNFVSANRGVVAGGERNTVSAAYGSVSGGSYNTAGEGYSSVVGGYYVKALGVNSIAGGNQSEARGLNSVAFGYKNNVTGDNSFILGRENTLTSSNTGMIAFGGAGVTFTSTGIYPTSDNAISLGSIPLAFKNVTSYNFYDKTPFIDSAKLKQTTGKTAVETISDVKATVDGELNHSTLGMMGKKIQVIEYDDIYYIPPDIYTDEEGKTYLTAAKTQKITRREIYSPTRYAELQNQGRNAKIVEEGYRDIGLTVSVLTAAIHELKTELCRYDGEYLANGRKIEYVFC